MGRTGRGSLPRGLEKSSGPLSGLASREADARRMFPAPPRPDEYYEESEIPERVKQERDTHETLATSGHGAVTLRRRRRSSRFQYMHDFRVRKKTTKRVRYL